LSLFHLIRSGIKLSELEGIVSQLSVLQLRQYCQLSLQFKWLKLAFLDLQRVQSYKRFTKYPKTDHTQQQHALQKQQLSGNFTLLILANEHIL